MNTLTYLLTYLLTSGYYPGFVGNVTAIVS